MKPGHTLSIVCGVSLAVLPLASSQTTNRESASQGGAPTDQAAQVLPAFFKQYDLSAVGRVRIVPGKEVIFQDTDGWPVFMRTARGLIVLEYDTVGNLAFAYGGRDGYHAEYVYDRHGRLHSIRYANGSTAMANYSADGRHLVSINKDDKVCEARLATAENFVTQSSPYGIRVEAAMFRDAFAYGRGQVPTGSLAEHIDWPVGCDRETAECASVDMLGNEGGRPIIIFVGERSAGNATSSDRCTPEIIISEPRPKPVIGPGSGQVNRR